MKRSMILAVLALGALAFAATGAAHPKLRHALQKSHAKIDRSAAGDPTKGHGPPVHANSDVYGPFSVTATDTGCSGAEWATDTLNRTFVIKRAKPTKTTDGTTTTVSPNWRVWVYDRGTFVTSEATSPGACDANATDHGSTIQAGVTGKLHGFMAGVISGGTYVPTATCTGDDCGSTAAFVATYFGPSAQFSCATTSDRCKFDFEYAVTGQQVDLHHWSDVGTGGGDTLSEQFRGDIAD